MHEQSLIRSLQAQVRQLAAAHGGGVVQRVRLQVGPLSGFEPALLQFAWDLSRDEAELSMAILEVDEVLLEAECQNCQRLFQPLRFCFVCPVCGSNQTKTVSGEGVVLESIVLDESRQGAAQ